MNEYNRKALNYLQSWLKSSDRNPMVIRGARQVGKTWTVRELAKQSKKQLVELNFEKYREYQSLFNSNDPAVIIRHIESHLEITIDPQQAILFLDEIQVVPELLSKLRWFAEDMSFLPVIAAGSLLDFVLDDHEFSMPVGRITYLHMEPLSFEEFLAINKRVKLLEYINHFSLSDIMPLAIHEKLLSLFKMYLIIGGMPAAVYAWRADPSINKINRIHHDLITAYRDDFAKYSGKIANSVLDDVLMSIPGMLGNKFIYSRVDKTLKSDTLKSALTLLVQARLCTKVTATAANGIPLAAEKNDKFFKVIALDVGLVSAMLGLKLNKIDVLEDINLVNNGGISEQAAGQLLRCIEPIYRDPELYYWQREAKSANAEVDYLLQHNGTIIPIEVKSGSTGSLKSLHHFMYVKKKSHALRINSDLPNQCEVNVKLHNQENVSYQLASIPFYLIEQLPRLMDEVLLEN
jgi:uncharacterized protein